MNYFNLCTFTLILLMVNFSYTQNSTTSKNEFCADQRNVISMFTMGNTSYAQIGPTNDVFYTKQLNETFSDKHSEHRVELFGDKLHSITTAFFVSKIPSCNMTFITTVQCNDLKKLNGKAFVIGNRENHTQSYTSFRDIGNGELGYIPDSSYMPFDMPITSKIEVNSNIFPVDGKDNPYLSATYDERDFAIVYLVKQSADICLYIIRLYILSPVVSQPKNMSPFFDRFILGFFQIYDTKANVKKTFVIFTSEEKDNVSIEEFQYSNHSGNKFKIEERFKAQSEIDLLSDVFGCPQIESTTRVTQTIGSTKGQQSEVLFLVIVIAIIGLILFLVLISILLYIRHKNQKNIKQNKSKSLSKASSLTGKGSITAQLDQLPSKIELKKFKSDMVP